MTDTSPEACGWPEQDAVDAWLSEHKIDVPFAAAMALKVAVTAWRIQMQTEAAALRGALVAMRADAVTVARMFHEAYENLAPAHGYETRQDTRDFDPASANGKLMIATCEAVMNALAIRALPLDAPAPVDPVADGAPSDYERKVAQMKEDFPNGI
jgi:hypothetical protein